MNLLSDAAQSQTWKDIKPYIVRALVVVIWLGTEGLVDREEVLARDLRAFRNEYEEQNNRLIRTRTPFPTPPSRRPGRTSSPTSYELSWW
jgi:hypothetical protein